MGLESISNCTIRYVNKEEISTSAISSIGMQNRTRKNIKEKTTTTRTWKYWFDFFFGLIRNSTHTNRFKSLMYLRKYN